MNESKNGITCQVCLSSGKVCSCMRRARRDEEVKRFAERQRKRRLVKESWSFVPQFLSYKNIQRISDIASKHKIDPDTLLTRALDIYERLT